MLKLVEDGIKRIVIANLISLVLSHGALFALFNCERFYHSLKEIELKRCSLAGFSHDTSASQPYPKPYLLFCLSRDLIKVTQLLSRIRNLLVVGVDSVSVANSAKKAGYNVCAADYFGDLDLRSVCSHYKSVIKQRRGKSSGRIESKFSTAAFLRMAKALSKTCRIDAMILSSGLDDDFRVLNELSSLAPILGNSVEVIQKVRKKRFFVELTSLGIDCPKTLVPKNADEAEAAATKIGYPVIVKSTKSFAGMSAALARNPEEIRRAYSEKRDLNGRFMIQEFIDGTHASISLLSTKNDVQILTINEQLLGLKSLFSPKPFGYCGNIVPFDVSSMAFGKCKNLTEKVASHFGLQGSNGIDVVISKENKPYVIEVNPRFQGTLECVEKVRGINVVQAHVNACLKGVLPRLKGKTSTYCTRLILYAPKRVKSPDLTDLPEVRDVPLVETIIEKGEPLCSVLAEGNSRDSSFENANALAESVYVMFHSA